MTLFTIITALIILVAVFIAMDSIFTVQTSQVAIVERLGRFKRIAQPGINFKIPIIDRVAQRLSLRVQQLDINLETKTKDNVIVALMVSTQYEINKESIQEAAYSLTNPNLQITSFVQDSVRAVVPTMTLDEAFEKKNEIADEVSRDVGDYMSNYGYKIIRALVVDIDPAEEVKTAMNKINSAEREKVAAQSEADAFKIKIIGEAQGHSEAKRLSGEGVANQRKAISDGLAEQHKALVEAGVENPDQILLMNQYFDTLSDITKNGAVTILLPGSPSGVGDFSEQIRNSIIAANQVSDSQ